MEPGYEIPFGKIGQQSDARVRHDPAPSVVTVPRGRSIVACTKQLPSNSVIMDFRQVQNPLVGKALSVIYTPDTPRDLEEPEGGKDHSGASAFTPR